MITPHGGRLINRIMTDDERTQFQTRAGTLKTIEVTGGKASEIQNIATGVYSPLDGFMNSTEVAGVADSMRLPDGTAWPIPIILDVPEDVSEGDEIILSHEGNDMAVMTVEEIFTVDKEDLTKKVFGTSDMDHPGVAKVYSFGDRFASGKITMINEYNVPFGDLYLRPAETRKLFEEMGWNRVVAFQTRNPPHVGHEYVQKAALTLVDGLLINPVIGKKKTGDFKDGVILDAYKALIKDYYPDDRATLSTLLIDMWYGGPREAILHAIMRKNLGCTHIIIGRDHAGVGSYYGPFDAHFIFDDFPDLEIQPIFFRSFFYCPTCMSVANDKICPHTDLINFSGTMVRAIVNEGKIPDPKMMRPEVAEVIASTEKPFVE